MKILKRFAAACLTVSLATGMLAGCNGKTYEVSYDYDASEYINLGEYKGVSVELEDYSVKDEDLQKVISQIQEQYCNYELVERGIQEKDRIILNFDAYISGQKVGGFSGENYELVIGSGNFLIEGFEEKLIGLKAGDKRAITGLYVPENFSQEKTYSGRAITFDVEILNVYEPVPAPYDDQFVNALTNGGYPTVEEYNKELVRQLEENAETNRYNAKYDAVMDKIIVGTTQTKELPEEYVTKRAEEITKTAEFYAGVQDITVEEYLTRVYGVPTAREAAENIILMEFIYQEIIRKENMVITAKDYSKNLVATAEKRGYTSTERMLSDYQEAGVVKLMLMDMAEAFIMNNAVEVAK